MKKKKLYQELVYFLAILTLSFSVAMISCTDFGLSMIVSPAYILSCKLGTITFGQSEYIIQAALFMIFCICMKKIKLVYFSSFVTGLIYGAALDFWRLVIPHFNPAVTAPGSLPFGLKAVYFVLGVLLTSFSIALFFRTYLYPQVYDFFVKGICARYGIKTSIFKTCFDLSFLVISCVMSLVMFKKFVGVGVGTVIMAVCNGTLIGLFGNLLDKFFVFVPIFEKFSRHFDIS